MRTRSGSMLLQATVALCCIALSGACGPAQPGLPPRQAGVDLLDRLGTVRAGTTVARESQSVRRHEWVERRGRRLATTTLLAPVIVQADLAGLSGRFTLKLLASPLFNVGDGLRLDVLVSGDGDAQLVCSRYFDAGRLASDRDWVPLEVPLNLSGAADSHLEIRVSAGPQGDLDADWLALAEARIVPEKAAL